MRFTSKPPPDIATIGKKVEADIKRFLGTRVTVALEQMQKAILETPVYTGRTMINYRWSLGSPITDTRSPIKNPQLPGKTSTLAIGQEPRRAANEAVVIAEFEAVITSFKLNPFQKIFLRNNVPNFTDIEYGVYGKNARTPPGGMTRRGESQIKIIIKGITRVR